MKPLPQTTFFRQEIAGARLYRNDLERILSIVAETQASVTIRDASFQYETVEEVRQSQGDRPNQLEIRAERDSLRLTVSLNARTWTVEQHGGTDHTVGRRIAEILKERQTIAGRAPPFSLVPPLLLAVMVSAGPLFSGWWAGP